MNINSFLALVFLCSLEVSSFGQNKKEIKKYKIRSVTETVTALQNNKPVTYKACITIYDKNGKIIEETEFNADGSVKKKETAKYDSNDNKIEETSFHQRDLLKVNALSKENENKKTTFKYNSNGDKTEENEYDATSGKLLRKQVILYNSKGEKVSEETFDGANKLIKKTVYLYDKGLKSQKQTYNKDNVLEETKKYTYTF